MIDSSQNRVFHSALLASLALHALLLFTFQNPDQVRGAPFPSPIVARLVEPEPAPAAVPPAKPMREEKNRVAPRVTRAAPTPTPIPIPEKPVEPTPPAAAPQAPLANIAPPTVSAPPTAEAPGSLSRDQYRLELIDEARRHKRYPPLARENNWQGDVRVAVVLGVNGRATVTLKDSSGYDVLDRQALEMFTQATRAVPVPPALRGKELVLDLRAVYGLED